MLFLKYNSFSFKVLKPVKKPEEEEVVAKPEKVPKVEPKPVEKVKKPEGTSQNWIAIRLSPKHKKFRVFEILGTQPKCNTFPFCFFSTHMFSLFLTLHLCKRRLVEDCIFDLSSVLCVEIDNLPAAHSCHIYWFWQTLNFHF